MLRVACSISVVPHFENLLLKIRTNTEYASMKTSLALIGLLLAPSLLFAESIRCGSQLIEKGSTSADLLEYCGKPARVVKNGTVNGLIGNTHTAGGITSQATGDFEIETWTYDFGPNQLMERVRIENGIVVQIDSLGYGHNQP
jgi:hypothetical protein